MFVRKPVASFTSALNRHGGQESTILALNNVFYQWRCLIAAPGYSDQGRCRRHPLRRVVDRRRRAPDDAVLAAAHYQGGLVGLDRCSPRRRTRHRCIGAGRSGIGVGRAMTTSHRAPSARAPARRADASVNPYDVLAAGNPVLRDVVARHGRPDPFHWPVLAAAGSDRFAGLVLHIVSQQISTTAALAIFARIEAAASSLPTPDAVTALGLDGLRGCGLSYAKAASLLDVSRRVRDGSLVLDRLDAVSDEQALAQLTAARGIGPWTAQMFLIHQLRRPDVLPAGDLGIRHAVQAQWRQDALPEAQQVAELGVAWSPYRTYAAALLWASLRPAPTGPP